MENLRPVELDSPLNRRVRVFLGIGPAPAEWAESLNLWVTEIGRRVTNWNWTALANLHVTLRFFGSVTQADVLRIGEILPEITRKISAFTMESFDLGLFPDTQQPRVAAIKLRDYSGELLELERAIRDQTSDIGRPPEPRDFKPHVTFGRIKQDDWKSQKMMGDLWRHRARPELPDWPVNEVTLFLSELQPGGSVYTPLAVFKLSAT